MSDEYDSAEDVSDEPDVSVEEAPGLPDIEEILRTAQPSWVTDRYGLRGPQPTIQRQAADVDWPSSQILDAPDSLEIPPLPESTPSVMNAAPGFYEDFQLIDASVYGTDGNLTTEHLQVKEGYVSFPVNSSDVGPLPTGFTEGDVPPFVIASPGSSGFAYVHVTFDPGTDTATALAIETGSSIPVNTSTAGYQVIGSFSTGTDGSGKTKFFVSGATGSLNYAYCGGNHFFWVA